MSVKDQRSVWRLWMLAVLLSAFPTAARAELYQVQSEPDGRVVAFHFSALGGAISAVLPSRAHTLGPQLLDMNLDITDSGVFYIPGADFYLDDSSSVIDNFGLGAGTISLTGATLRLTAGPLSADHGNGYITAADAGGISINGGTLTIDFPTALLHASTDLATDPIFVPFSSLAVGLKLPFSADDSGVNTTPHTNDLPGLTGVSNIDTYGTQVFFNLSGPTITIPLPGMIGTGSVTVTSAQILLGVVPVPEPSTFALAALALSGMGLVALGKKVLRV